MPSTQSWCKLVPSKVRGVVVKVVVMAKAGKVTSLAVTTVLAVAGVVVLTRPTTLTAKNTRRSTMRAATLVHAPGVIVAGIVRTAAMECVVDGHRSDHHYLRQQGCKWAPQWLCGVVLTKDFLA